MNVMAAEWVSYLNLINLNLRCEFQYSINQILLIFKHFSDINIKLKQDNR